MGIYYANKYWHQSVYNVETNHPESAQKGCRGEEKRNNKIIARKHYIIIVDVSISPRKSLSATATSY